MSSLKIIALAIALILSQYLAPWWSFTIACTLIGFFSSFGKWKTFFLGAGLLFLVWMTQYLYVELRTGSNIGEQAAGMMHLPGKYILYAASSFFFALIAGLSALLGYFLTVQLPQKIAN